MTSSSPLTEASPNSLADLFAKDPFKLTEQDLTVLVTELRRARGTWLVAEAGGAKRAPKVQAKAGLSLDDLGL